jgi:hypothetical protein
MQLWARSLQKDPPRASSCQREFLRFIRPLQPAELSTGTEAWALLRRSDGSWTNEYHAVQLEDAARPGFQCVRFTKFPARTLIERDTLPLAPQSLSLSSAQTPLFPTLIQLLPVLPLRGDRAEIVPSQQQRGVAAQQSAGLAPFPDPHVHQSRLHHFSGSRMQPEAVANSAAVAAASCPADAAGAAAPSAASSASSFDWSHLASSALPLEIGQCVLDCHWQPFVITDANADSVGLAARTRSCVSA